MLGQKFNNKGVTAYKALRALVQRPQDLGLIELYSDVSSIDIVEKVMMHINGYLNASQKHKGRLLKYKCFVIRYRRFFGSRLKRSQHIKDMSGLLLWLPQVLATKAKVSAAI